MALTCLERRLPPLRSTFLDFSPESDGARRRRHSHGGYTPHALTNRTTPPRGFYLVDDDEAGVEGTTNTLSTFAPNSPGCASSSEANSTIPLTFSTNHNHVTEEPSADYGQGQDDDDDMHSPPPNYFSEESPSPPPLFCSEAHDGYWGGLPDCNNYLPPSPEQRRGTRPPSSRRAASRKNIPIGAAPPPSLPPPSPLRQFPSQPQLPLTPQSPGGDQRRRSPPGTPDSAPIGSSPGSESLLQTSASEVQLDGEVTTLMIRNLPLHLKQQDLLDELYRSSFAGLYDFAYMPCSFQTGEGKGFAFVNFASASVAEALVTAWHRSRRLGIRPREPQLNISPAEIQGLEANLARWSVPRMRRIRNPNLRPFTPSVSTSVPHGRRRGVREPLAAAAAGEAPRTAGRAGGGAQ